MPAKNIVKFYLNNSIYHVYSRGVEKRKIFIDDQDYKVFLGYLKEYLSPYEKISAKSSSSSYSNLQGVTLQVNYHSRNNFSDQISLLAFCLMPNHIHLLIKQKDKDSIKKFTKSLFTRYSMYFNKRYDRVGPLFQSTYKATNVINKDYLLDITRYIHRNPYKHLSDITQAYSSYAHYLNMFNLPWVKKDEVLTYFNKSGFIKFNKIKNYKYFVETFKYKDETIDLSKEPEGLHPAS